MYKRTVHKAEGEVFCQLVVVWENTHVLEFFFGSSILNGIVFSKMNEVV